MHLLAAVSNHGFGHLAQVGPVVNALRRRLPGLRLTVRSGLPREVLERKIEPPFGHSHARLDFGMVMADAVGAKVAESHAAYREFHRDWEAKVAAEAQALAAFAPDLILADIPYLTLAGAQRAGVSAVAMCSLNWADIYGHYCGHLEGAAEIVAQMRAAYAGAVCFLRPSPAMPMADLANGVAIGPIAQPGRRRRGEIEAALGLAAGERLVLVGLGGIPTRLPVENWPRRAGIRWLVPREWAAGRPDMHPQEALGMPFPDLIASCDVLLTKPGYGAFVEAACSGTAVLYQARPDWPESPFLEAWLERHGRAREVAAEQLVHGELGDVLEALWAMPAPPRPTPSGIDEAVERLAGYLAA